MLIKHKIKLSALLASRSSAAYLFFIIIAQKGNALWNFLVEACRHAPPICTKQGNLHVFHYNLAQSMFTAVFGRFWI